MPDAGKKRRRKKEKLSFGQKIIKTRSRVFFRPSAVKKNRIFPTGIWYLLLTMRNRVAEGSRFATAAEPHHCSRQHGHPPGCGSTTQGKWKQHEEKIKPIDERSVSPPRIESSAYTILPDQPPHEAPQELPDEPGIPAEQEPAVPFEEIIAPGSDLIIPEPDRKPEPAPAVYLPPKNSGSAPADKSPGPKKTGDRWNLKPGKKVILGIIAIVIIIAVVSGGIFLYPMISKGGTSSADSSAPATVATTPKPTGTFVIPTETPEVIIPAKAYVHINYLGSWNGTYGIPSEIRRVTNSGNRSTVENATAP
jgi:hypothetical protein